jgi:c(7)-type cytochrome triheme protein
VRKSIRTGTSFAIAVAFAALTITASADAAAPESITLDGKIESMKKAGVGAVSFPHLRHEKAFKCADCHPKIFVDKKGANDISMKANMKGEFCGSAGCHNSPKAFPLFECGKCHTKIDK